MCPGGGGAKGLLGVCGMCVCEGMSGNGGGLGKC